ncbi:hypothetical protein V6N13_072172 [Hibiscus sabdariffa]
MRHRKGTGNGNQSPASPKSANNNAANIIGIPPETRRAWLRNKGVAKVMRHRRGTSGGIQSPASPKSANNNATNIIGTPIETGSAQQLHQG